MRQVRILLAIMALLSGCGLALAGDTLALSAAIGFGGYYRPHTLVPIAVNIQNNGDTLHADLLVTSQTEGVFAGRYDIPVTIPRGANQLRFLYVTPQKFAKDITVECWSHGEKIAEAPLTNCQELNDTGRLLVVTGGSGSAFNYMGVQTIHPTRNTPAPRPWDFDSQTRAQNQGFQMNRGGPVPQGPGGIPGLTGILSVAYVNRNLLPDNPEAYGSISVLALMSDTTENNLPAGAQDAIPLWVASGGHLLVAGGGIPSRLQASFFTRLLPLQHGQPAAGADVLTTPNGGQAVVGRVGAGYVTALNYDPESEPQERHTAAFYQQLFTREPSSPAAVLLQQQLDSAIMVRNLQPPNLLLIIVYLLVYLVILVPVNYFVLKKLDKREMAWVTTPVIVLLFTLGAYGIGYATKGHHLVLNQISVVETSAGQPSAEAVSELLIFSPERTSYDLDLGDTGLMATEINRDDANGNGNNYRTPYQQEAELSSAFSFIDTGGKQSVRDIGVNMWDFRQLAMAHTVNLQGGFADQLIPAHPGATPRATGTVTNNTPFHFANCALYCDGAQVCEFSLDPQQTVTVEKMGSAHQTPLLNEDQQHMYDSLQPQVAGLLSGKPELAKGFTLFGYTTDTLCPVRLSGHAPTTNLSLFVVHLQGEASIPEIAPIPVRPGMPRLGAPRR